MQMRNPSPGALWNIAEIGSFLLLLFILLWLARPIWDIDTYWHLATGRHFAETWKFIYEDPFGTASADPSRGSLFNLYWLAQLVFYASYQLCGDYGIILLRLGVFASIFSLVFLRFHAFPEARLYLPFVFVLMGFLSVNFTGDRPNLFSFLFAPVLILQLEAVFTRGTASPRERLTLMSVPLLMVFWANMHGGYILGSVIILLYLGAGFYQSWRTGTPLLWLPSLILLAAILVTGLTPNGFSPYFGVASFEGSELQGRTSEYLPPWTFSLDTGFWAYWLYGALLVFVVVARRRVVALRHLLLFVLLLCMSLRATRYVPLFVFGTAVCLPLYLSCRYQVKNLAMSAVAACVIAIAFNFPLVLQNVRSILASPNDRNRFPVEIVNYLKGQDLSGRIFNHLNFGGYLLWELPPSFKVFIDGRILNANVFKDYTRILWLPAEIDKLLASHQVNLVVIPERNPHTSERYPLFDHLSRSPGWVLLTKDRSGVLFSRRAPI